MEQKRHLPRRAINLLLPPFQPFVYTICSALVARGHQPFVYETRRTLERARDLKRRGKDRRGEKSLYLYGAAVHIIDRIHRYHNPVFFEDLSAVVERLGLVGGSRMAASGTSNSGVSVPDKVIVTPHVLAIPLGLHKRFRELPTEEHRAVFLSNYFRDKRIVPIIGVK